MIVNLHSLSAPLTFWCFSACQKRSGKDAAVDRLFHRVSLSFDHYFNIKTLPKRYENEGKALQP